MNNIVILIGGRNVGKSSILRSLCCIEIKKDLERVKSKLYLDFNSEKVLTFILSSSPQESSPFCKFETVIDKLRNFIKKSEEKAKEERVSKFILLIAFTLQVNRDGELGKDCIIEPLEFLKSLTDYKVHVVHVYRENTRYDHMTNEFIKNNNNPELTLDSEETAKKRQDDNAKKLKEFLSTSVN